MRPVESRLRRLPVRFAIVACGLLLLAACDLGSPSRAPSATCSESGVQCQLPDGPLGVCERTPCPAGAGEPCFRCVPQH